MYLSKQIYAFFTTYPLRNRIQKINQETGLHIQLVTGEPKAFSGMMAYGSFSGVKNYLVMAGKKGDDLDEKIGYWGEDLVLLAQTLGLNSCWVGLTYSKVSMVSAKPLFSMAGYSKMDLGIVKYHFEIGAGKESFEWA